MLIERPGAKSKPSVFVQLAGLLVCIFCLSSCTAVAQDESSAYDFVARYYENFQQPGFLVDELMDFYHDDAVFTDPTFGIAVQGKPAIRALYADIGTSRTAYRDIQWDLQQVIADNNRVVIRGVWSGNFQGCDFSVDFMTLWLLEDNLIREQNDFFAAAAFDEQVQWDPVSSTATCGSEASPGA